ncbi:AAA family ATPase [Streptomyces goshikiensis]|uniref:AAA family ATPase n=1 Tax=Streptomyces goshikiensis TaxID=1942 RepID=UPI0036A797D9
MAAVWANRRRRRVLPVRGRSLVFGVGGFPDRAGCEEDRARGVKSFTHLKSVAPAVKEIARALQRAGLSAVLPTMIDRSRSEVKAAWKQVRDDCVELPLVMVFSGHGERGRDESLYLAPIDGEATADRVGATCISMDKLLRDAEERFRAPVLFLLDVCGGGQALATQLAQKFSAFERKAWVIAACRADEITSAAMFTLATATVLDRLSERELDLSPALRYVPLNTLAAEIDRELARRARAAGALPQSVVSTMHEEARIDPPPFFENPAYAPDAPGQFLAGEDANLRQFAANLDPGLDPLHFITRAAGRTADQQQNGTFLFCGRAAQLRTISDWLDNAHGDRGRLLVVAGSPGNGKSALLGMTVCVTHPAFNPLRQGALRAAAGFRPEPGKRVIAVHARQLGTQQIVDSLLRQLTDRTAGHPSGGPGPRATGTRALMEALREAGPVVIVLDALDEAIDPGAVLSDLLLPLAGHSREDPAPDCRVMIGTRPWWDSFHDLHDVLATRQGALLDLDVQDRDGLAQDLGAYSSSCSTTTTRRPSSSTSPTNLPTTSTTAHSSSPPSTGTTSDPRLGPGVPSATNGSPPRYPTASSRCSTSTRPL